MSYQIRICRIGSKVKRFIGDAEVSFVSLIKYFTLVIQKLRHVAILVRRVQDLQILLRSDVEQKVRISLVFEEYKSLHLSL